MEKYPKQLTQKELGKMTSIAKAAAKLFHEKGYLETSMDYISTAAKLSKGGIYHYFSSKNEILYFISTNFMALLLKDLEQELGKIEDNLSKIQLKVLTFILFGTCNGIYYWYDPKGSVTPEELSKIMSDILCKGLLGFGEKE